MWIWLVLLYGVLKGAREICKKKALTVNSTMEVLFVYTLLSFLIVVPDIKNAMGLEPRFFGFILIKSFVIFLAWIFSFKAIKKLPISLYGVLDLSRVLFATLLGTLVLSEIMTPLHVIGLILVCLGLILLKFQKSTSDTSVKPLYVMMAFASCVLNAVSGFLDKVLMKDINSSQLQFWYMLFLVLMYFIFILFTKTPINYKSAIKNKWIWILSIMFVIGDRALFIGNASPDSQISIMTLLKQAGSIVTILAGRFIFKEKNTTHKLICAVIIIAGIVLGVM